MIRIRDSFPIPGRTPATWWLIGLNVLSFVSVTYYGAQNVLLLGGIHPQKYFPIGSPLTGLDTWGLIPLIWYQFLHAGWFHLLSNCLTLAVLGPNVEAYMGRNRFVLFYLTCGCLGGLFQIVGSMGADSVVIGASGAISGLVGAYMAVFPKNYIRITLGNLRRGSYRDFMIPIKVLLVFWVASQIMDALMPNDLSRPTIAYFTHLGGFLGGYLLARGRGRKKPKFKVTLGGKYAEAG